MKYFTIDRIKEAIDCLGEVDGKTLVPALVFACNGANQAASIKLSEREGTDRLLDQFFTGSLIGLPAMASGANSLRPKFKDLKRTFGMEGKDSDYIIQQNTRLWANVYSRAGYRVMADRGLIETGGPSEFRLKAEFGAFIDDEIPVEFPFEEVLVWLYAFSGIDEEINSWADLLRSFEERFVGAGNHFDPLFSNSFKVSVPALPWPDNFLADRPSNEDFQKELMPSSFVLQLAPNDLKDIRDALLQRFNDAFQGYTEEQALGLCSDLVAAITATKRVFLLGDPGVGKTVLSGLVIEAFRDVVGDDRLYYVQEPITDKTTPETLIGYGGITGEWIPGSLTSVGPGGKSLLVSGNDLADPNKRNQVNVIVLDECNRRNIEALLSRFQNSMDSQSLDPKDVAHSIRLDAGGTFYLSPNTYWIMTGNSPLSDQGRLPQSRPFRRRPNLIALPNVAESSLSEATADEFRVILKTFWESHCQTGLIVSDNVAGEISDNLQNNEYIADDLLSLFSSLIKYDVGISYGLIEKLLRTTAANVSIDMGFTDAFDSSLATALLPLLSTDRLVEDRSLQAEIFQSQENLKDRFPRFWTSIQVLDSGSEFGIVKPFF